MSTYATEYGRLNKAQKQAVDTIEGPLLVIAGPGTGKTQLLGARAAHIVKQGAVGPSNILCMTYTETGATEMRERMTKIMGPNGSEVAVYTFHGFGSWLINQYPEQFTAQRALRPLDDLTNFRILERLLSKLPLRHPLAVHGENDTFIRQHAVSEAIGAFKQAGLSPDEVRTVIKANEQAYPELQPLIDETFGSTLGAKRLESILASTQQHIASSKEHSLTAILLEAFKSAVDESIAIGKTKPLGDWRTKHTVIKNGERILKSQSTAKLLVDTVDIYEKYQNHLTTEGLYDYEDMVLWAIRALESNEDMRLDVAERFQYLMVDEYQDTNGAQNRLLDAILGANPLDSPNVMVVGDDDQAIMRFQGAEVSGTLRFIKRYKPLIITLEDNYRSTQAILDASRQIILQTDERLEVALPEQNLSKQLKAKGTISGDIAHYRYASPSAQYAGVTKLVQELIGGGTPANEIAIIGRKHAELANFIPFLAAAGVPTRYDGRQNVLEVPELNQLLQLATYIEALTTRSKRAASLLPTVLAAPYWELKPLATYELAARARNQGNSWLDVMLEDPTSELGKIAEWLLSCAETSRTTNFTQILDVLVGRDALGGAQLGTSPFGSYLALQNSEAAVTLFSHLIRLRAAVLDNQPHATGLTDLLTVVQDYIRSNTRLTDTNPVLSGDRAGVQVMSAHGAKGREFKHVIVLSALDNVWGTKARGSTGRIRLPENLPLYPAGDAESDKLRLLYVAMTRAKSNLLLTSYEQTDGGSKAISLSYLELGDEDSSWWQPQTQDFDHESRLQTLETAWNAKPAFTRSLKQKLDPLLQNYKLSPSAIRTFLDLRYGGPLAAIEQHVLKFPSAYTASSALGTAAHKVLHRAQQAFVKGTPLSQKMILEVFDQELDNSGLAKNELETVREHGHQFLPECIKQLSTTDFKTITATEEFLTATLPDSNVSIIGALDAVAQTDGSLKIIDYKTGKPPLPEWKTTGLSDSKKTSLHFYRQQLMIYKLLVDNSAKYKDHKGVTDAELIFVEPDAESGEFIRLSIDQFDQAELDRTAKLINAIYQRIVSMDLPDISEYSKDLKNIQAFEQKLIDDYSRGKL